MNAERRFEIVVLNHRRLHLFFRNFGRVRGFDPARDRLTVVSCSPSDSETALVKAFEAEHGLPVRYLIRPNLGMEQRARLDYFTGQVGTVEDNLGARFVFQMQDHYLAADDPASRWGAEFDHGLKGDVAPEDLIFDLDAIERLDAELLLDGFFADRNDPCLVEWEGRRYIAPNGSNFGIRGELLREPGSQRAFRHMLEVFERGTPWLTYCEYSWGRFLFPEGRRLYDLKRDKLVTEWTSGEFHDEALDDYPRYFADYDSLPERSAATRATRRAWRWTHHSLVMSARRLRALRA